METEFRVSLKNSDAVRAAASDLGLKILDEKERKGAGGEAMSIFVTLASDPFVQGAFFGYLVSRQIRIEVTKDDRVIIEITGLKKLVEWAKKFLG